MFYFHLIKFSVSKHILKGPNSEFIYLPYFSYWCNHLKESTLRDKQIALDQFESAVHPDGKTCWSHSRSNQETEREESTLSFLSSCS